MTSAFFTVDRPSRTIRGLMLPWGEASRQSVSTDPVMFERGTISLPRDPSVVTGNVGHDRFMPVARTTVLEDTERGVEFEAVIADTDEGDDALAGIESGRLTKISAEVTDFMRDGAKAVSARLTGFALVPEGAFASAALFAIAGEVTELSGDLDGAPGALPVAIDGDTTERTAEAAAQIPATEAEPDEDTPESANTEGDAMPEAIATLPEGVNPAGSATNVDQSASALFSAVAKYNTNGDASALFAISTVQHSGPSAVTIGADVQDPAYLGELWKRKSYTRKFLPLFEQRALTSFKVDGWRWTTEPTVAAYAGNVAEIPSGAVDTEPVSATARRIAGGHRIDRRFADFGDQGVIESYFRLMTESYARVSDLDILAKAVTAAGAAVDVGSIPSGIAKGLVGIVDGALSVIASGNTPSFSIVDPVLWREIILSPKEDVFAFLNAGFGLEEGAVDSFRIVPGTVGTDNVLTGAREALTVFELPGSPIRVEGLAPHNGAIDPALYGYLADLTNNSSALSLIHTTPA